MMNTILDSIEGEISTHQKIFDEIIEILKQNWKIHIYTIYYWSCSRHYDMENCFEVSPRAREIFLEIKDNIF